MSTPEAEAASRGSRLRILRSSLKWSQTEAAKRFGVDRAWLSKVENDKNQGTGLASMAAIAAGLGVSMEDALAYLDGHTELDAFLAKVRAAVGKIEAPAPSDGSSVRTRIVVGDDPYPNRREAVAFARENELFADSVIDLVARADYAGATGWTVDDWMEELFAARMKAAKWAERARTMAEPSTSDDDGEAPNVDGPIDTKKRRGR